MSELDDIFNEKKPSDAPIQSPLMRESAKSLDLPSLSQEIERRARKRRILVGWFKFFGFILVMGLMIAVIGMVGAYLYCKPRYDLAQTFDLDNLEKLEVASRIVDRNGQELGRIFVQNRRPISIDEVSDHFINALIAAEDGSFYTHDGVDYKGVIRAVYLNFKSKEINQGASTITQQLARNTFELRDRTVSRKVTEAFLARRIEKELGDKQRVLELYVNRIYFGSGYYGIAAASEGFFGKEAKDLTIVEAATLAGVIRNPYYRSPRKYPDSCKKTRDYVLTLMRKEGYIDRETMERALKSPVRAVDKQSLTGKSGYVYEKVRQEVIDIIGAEEVNSGGFVIETTIDSELQTVASQSIKDQLAMIEEHPHYKGETYAEYREIKRKYSESEDDTAALPNPQYLQGALILIDNRTGAILAQVGGREFQDSMFDRTTLGRFRTGTAFTPFVYAAAFEKGFFPGTLLNDTPMNNKKVMIGGLSGILGEWGTESPSEYLNTVTARQALSLGKNAATVRMGMQAGLSTVVDVAERAGFEFPGDLKKFNATMLGRNEASVTDMALAYTIFPNQGVRPEKTHIISNIRDAMGNVIYKPTITRASQEAIDRYTAYQVSSILSDSFQTGTARKAREKYGLGNYPVAGKTGTEYDYTDNWFAGFTSEVTCVAWIGFDQREKIYDGAFSSDTVLPAWTKVMNAAAKVTDPQPFRPPVDAEKVEICLKSGELACDDCYQTVVNADGISSQVRSTYVEYLRPDTDLSSICHIHARGGTLRDLKRLSQYLPQKQNFSISIATTDPILPVAPTIIGDDPYNAVKPVHTLVAMPVASEDTEPEMGKNGLPIARPEALTNPFEDMPIKRVRLTRPSPIQFD